MQMHTRHNWIGVQDERRERSGAERAQKSRMELGMQGFVAQTIDMYRRGFDSRRMLLQVCACHMQPTLFTYHACAGVTHKYIHGVGCRCSIVPFLSCESFEFQYAGLQQSLAQEEDGAVSQGADFMQQNTRVVVLTLEASLQPLIITQSLETFASLLVM